MQLSEDKKKLIAVDESELTNGAFIIPDGVIYVDKNSFNNHFNVRQLTFPTGAFLKRLAFSESINLTRLVFGDEVKIISVAFYLCTGITQITFGERAEIYMQGFDSCTGISRATFGKGAILWYGVFKGCSSITQVELGEGAKLHKDAFIECHALQSIMVNTCSDKEIERVQNSLSEEYRQKVIKNPLFSRVIAFQESVYQMALPSIGLSDLVYSSNALKKWPFLLLSSAISYEQKVYQYFKKVVACLRLPTTIEEFSAYKKEYIRLAPKSAPESVALWNRLDCIDMMQSYFDYLNTLVETKQHRFPSFFSDDRQLFLKIKTKFDVISKVIEWLKGNDNLTFTPNEITVLYGETLIARKLNKFSIELPKEDCAALPMEVAFPK